MLVKRSKENLRITCIPSEFMRDTEWFSEVALKLIKENDQGYKGKRQKNYAKSPQSQSNKDVQGLVLTFQVKKLRR